ncbi:hypothetical protein MZA91_04990, partial [Haemophilus influenzae]|nr:hypothetical protein [Haemophilus influenzae]
SQVGPPHYRRQDNSFDNSLFSFISRLFYLSLLSLYLPFTRSYWSQAESDFLSIKSSILLFFV